MSTRRFSVDRVFDGQVDDGLRRDREGRRSLATFLLASFLLLRQTHQLQVVIARDWLEIHVEQSCCGCSLMLSVVRAVVVMVVSSVLLARIFGNNEVNFSSLVRLYFAEWLSMCGCFITCMFSILLCLTLFLGGAVARARYRRN